MMQQQFAKEQMPFIPFAGGLSTSGMALARRPGTLDAVMNYEPALDGGYTRTKGYERFSGMPAPSGAELAMAKATMTSTVAPGTAVTIGAATALFVGVYSPSVILLTDLVGGALVAGTSIMAAGQPVGSITGDEEVSTESVDTEAELLSLCQDVRRASIGTVPGAGPVRGVAVFKNKVYAWRNDVIAGGAMYASSPTGWQRVTFGEEVAFSAANANVKVGQVLTKGVVTATIKAVVIESGSLQSGTNTGRLIISGRAGGALSAGAATVAGGGTLTLGGASTQIALPAGGLYRSVVHNFKGGADRECLYFVNGVGKAHEFDGETLVPINTGATDDRPAYVCQHSERLILGSGASITWSVASAPTSFDGVLGAQVFAMGATLTGFVTLPGKSLGIATDKSIRLLIGTPSSTMDLQTVSAEYGAMPGAVLATVDMYALSSFGVVSLRASDKFGSFEADNGSDDFAAAARKLAKVFSCAARVDISESENQLRYMGSDGSGLVLLIQGGGVVAATTIKYPVTPIAMTSGSVDGVERVFFAADNGYVYEITGESPSFDGEEIEAYLRTNALTMKTPLVDKTFRDAFVEIASVRASRVSISCELSSGTARSEPTDLVEFITSGSGGLYDVNDFDTFFLDAPDVSSPKVRIGGAGRNLSMLFYSISKVDYGHTLQGVSVRYSARKTTRQA
jgi:hypothetical protein